MALEGMNIPKLLGWISGVFFISKPWGDNRHFVSYCHPYTLYALFLNVAFLMLWKDFFEEIRILIKDKRLVMQIFILSYTLNMHIFNFYIRCVFFGLARKISILMRSIDSVLPQSTVFPKDLRCAWVIIRKIMWCIFMIHTLSAVASTVFIYYLSEHNHRSNTMFFHDQYRPWWYFIVLFVFGTFPTAICVYFAFGFIFSTTFCVLAIFEDFSLSLHVVGKHYLEETGRLSDKHFEIDNFTLRPLASDNDDLTNLDQDDIEVRRSSVVFSPSWDVMKADLLHRFDQVKSIFAMYDFVVGPILLGLIIRNVFSVINGATAIIVGENPLDSTVDRGCGWLHLLLDLLQFIILELGSWTSRRMDKWKMDLEKMIILMPTSLEKDHLSDVVHQVCKWKWQMSAWGFFHVNRQLMSGIVSTMLSYIVILFQLNVSENSG